MLRPRGCSPAGRMAGSNRRRGAEGTVARRTAIDYQTRQSSTTTRGMARPVRNSQGFWHDPVCLLPVECYANTQSTVVFHSRAKRSATAQAQKIEQVTANTFTLSMQRLHSLRRCAHELHDSAVRVASFSLMYLTSKQDTEAAKQA